MSLDFSIMDKGEASGIEFELFSANATHNLAPMWHMAKIYSELYESGGKQPKMIIKQLKKGLNEMTSDPLSYKALNPINGWGNYEGAINFLRLVIEACEKYPTAEIHISR